MHNVVSRNGMSDTQNGTSEEQQPLASMGSSANLQDWKRSLSTPARYRLGPATIHVNMKAFLSVLFVIICVVVIGYFYKSNCSHLKLTPGKSRYIGSRFDQKYDPRYPITKPIEFAEGLQYRIGIISDLDENSNVKDNPSLWRSYFLHGYLYVYNNGSFHVEFDKVPIELHSSIAQGGRGMELSELVTFDGKLLSVDDRTGIVYRIINDVVVPWVILPDGNGEVTKGFKSEWATVKDGSLYVGGLGKEWTTKDGHVLNHDPQFVKKITPTGGVLHEDWKHVYDSIKVKAGYPSPGYMIHEACVWSDVHRKWFFLPRRASTERYNDVDDEKRATNELITCDENFQNIVVKKNFGPRSATHGFSSFKFIPSTDDKYIIALKSEEDSGKTATYVIIMDLDGETLLAETLIGHFKFEGIEFI